MKKPQPIKTEHTKLKEMLFMYEKILHPDIFNELLKQLFKAYDENKAEAYLNAKISDDALWIEQQFNDIKEQIKRTSDERNVKMFYVKCFYKTLLKKLIPEL